MFKQLLNVGMLHLLQMQKKKDWHGDAVSKRHFLQRKKQLMLLLVMPNSQEDRKDLECVVAFSGILL